jgi:hypothetical protein
MRFLRPVSNRVAPTTPEAAVHLPAIARVLFLFLLLGASNAYAQTQDTTRIPASPRGSTC